MLGLVVLLAAIAYLAVELGVPVGGISRGDAVRASANALPSSTAPTVDWAIVAPLGLFRGGATDLAAPWDQIVWVVRLRGTYPPASCGGPALPGAPQRCPPDDHTATVMLDYRTGQFAMATIEP